ncbi:MAG: S8 family serine peptidase, partial [Ardenticatenales bacterium]|nr:S8 family serine peptidase [Ardenticatenales bacterium]
MSRKSAHFIFSLLLLFSLLLPLVGTAPTRAHASAGAVVDPALKTALATATGPLEVIVTFQGSKAPGDAELSLLRGLGITQGLTMRSLPIAGVLANAAQVDALAARPEVRSLWLNTPLSYDNFDARALTGVDRIRRDATLTLRNGGLPVGGQGITVLVNDSGAEGLHADLAPNIIQNTSGATNLHGLVNVVPVTYVEGVPHTDIAGGHGTHVAGIVAGTGAKSGGKYEGVAPGAKLVVYGSGAGLLLLDTIGGFDYALTNQFRYGIRVVTNSWGATGDKTDFNPDHPTNVATKLLTDRNIVVVFSAGNSGPNAGTITGNFKKAPWVITVAAGDKNRQLASFSSRGTKDKDRPTLTAPGVDIISTRAVLGAPLGATSDVGVEPAYLPYYTSLSGTSMAAPHVAGIVALMLDANPKLTPAQVKQILQDTATLMPGYESWEVGAGYADAYKAVQRAFGMTVTDVPNNLDIVSTPTPTPTPTSTPVSTGGTQVIVSVIDSAVNPYHEFFNAGGEPYQSAAPSSVTPALLAALGVDSNHILKLTRTGNFSA